MTPSCILVEPYIVYPKCRRYHETMAHVYVYIYNVALQSPGVQDMGQIKKTKIHCNYIMKKKMSG